VLAITALTGYFVAQEFGYMATSMPMVPEHSSCQDTRPFPRSSCVARVADKPSRADQYGISQSIRLWSRSVVGHKRRMSRWVLSNPLGSYRFTV
jgi:hypothetical protein